MANTQQMKRMWIVRVEDDVEGHPWKHLGEPEEDVEGQRLKATVVRPASEDDTEGHLFKHLGETEEDAEAQMVRRLAVDEPDDTIGHPRIKFIAPMDPDQGLYLIEAEGEDDVTGQVYRVRTRPGGEGGGDALRRF